METERKSKRTCQIQGSKIMYLGQKLCKYAFQFHTGISVCSVSTSNYFGYRSITFKYHKDDVSATWTVIQGAHRPNLEDENIGGMDKKALTMNKHPLQR